MFLPFGQTKQGGKEGPLIAKTPTKVSSSGQILASIRDRHG
jgi:hypothetical protein